MKEVLRTNDPVRLSYAMALLEEAGCKPFTADQFAAAVDGGISAVQRRILVPGEYAEAAKEALKALDAGDGGAA
jgi:hypothetical protein